MSEEVWAEFPDEPGYFVSTLGRVRGPSGRILAQSDDGRGYFKVHARMNGRFYRIHRMVLITFAGRPGPGQVVRHLNGVKSDNRFDNLAWGTISENSQDCIAHGQNLNALKTHCPHGHPYSGRNLGISRTGGRFCKACKYARDRARIIRKRMAMAS